MRIIQLPLLVIVVVAAIATFSPASSAANAARTDDDVSALVRGALESASSLPGARVELVSVERRPDACAVGAQPRAEVPLPVDGSGKFAVKLVGTRSGGAAPCQAWVWARVRLFATVSVATRTIRAGEPFAGATNTGEREIRPGRLPATALEGATAERTVGVGQMVEADVVRQPGLRPGDPVKVVIVAGAMSIEQTGRAVACARNHNCAVLPSGRHVDGALVAGRLLVEMP